MKFISYLVSIAEENKENKDNSNNQDSALPSSPIAPLTPNDDYINTQVGARAIMFLASEFISCCMHFEG